MIIDGIYSIKLLSETEKNSTNILVKEESQRTNTNKKTKCVLMEKNRDQFSAKKKNETKLYTGELYKKKKLTSKYMASSENCYQQSHIYETGKNRKNM